MGKSVDNLNVRQMCLFPELSYNKMAGVDKVVAKYCRTCIHRKRYELNEKSNKVVQCCELQKSKHSNSGYKTIKVTDVACMAYKEEER